MRYSTCGARESVSVKFTPSARRDRTLSISGIGGGREVRECLGVVKIISLVLALLSFRLHPDAHCEI